MNFLRLHMLLSRELLKLQLLGLALDVIILHRDDLLQQHVPLHVQPLLNLDVDLLGMHSALHLLLLTSLNLH